MQFLRRLFEFYVFSNIHVALAVASLTKVSLVVFERPEKVLPIFIFFATLFAYNFIRLYRRAEISSWFYDWIQEHQILLITLTALSFFVCVYLGFKLDKNTIVTLVPLGALTLFYVIPIGGTSLRGLSGFKLFLIAICWAIVTVVLPIIEYSIPIRKEEALIFIQRILFVAAITLPFDIRDLSYDQKSLRTIPQLLGVAMTKRMGILLLMLFVGLNFLKEDPPQFLTIEFVISLIALLLLVRSTERQHRYYSAFFVEALPIVWLALLLLEK